MLYCWVQSILSSWDRLLINPGLSWTNFTIYTHTHTHTYSYSGKIKDWICDWRWKTCKINFKSLKVTELSFINLRSDLFWFLKRLKELSCDVTQGVVECHFVLKRFWYEALVEITVPHIRSGLNAIGIAQLTAAGRSQPMPATHTWAWINCATFRTCLAGEYEYTGVVLFSSRSEWLDSCGLAVSKS